MNNFIKTTYLLVIFAIVTLCNNIAFANDIDDALSAYKSGDYNRAITLLDSVSKKDGVSSALYYDLGNAYLKIGDNGNAMLCYLRSIRLDPSNSQAKENIKYLDNKVYESNKNELKGKKYSFDKDSPSVFSTIRLYIVRDHLSNTWATWAVVSFLIFLVCLALYIYTKNVLARKIGFFGSFISLGVTAFFVAFSFMAASYVSDEGVIISSKVKLKKEASATADEGEINLTKGTRMTILNQEPVDSKGPKWYKVRLNSDFIGWIQDSDFVPVD